MSHPCSGNTFFFQQFENWGIKSLFFYYNDCMVDVEEVFVGFNPRVSEGEIDWWSCDSWRGCVQGTKSCWVNKCLCCQLPHTGLGTHSEKRLPLTRMTRSELKYWKTNIWHFISRATETQRAQGGNGRKGRHWGEMCGCPVDRGR